MGHDDKLIYNLYYLIQLDLKDLNPFTLFSIVWIMTKYEKGLDPVYIITQRQWRCSLILNKMEVLCFQGQSFPSSFISGQHHPRSALPFYKRTLKICRNKGIVILSIVIVVSTIHLWVMTFDPRSTGPLQTIF